MRAEETIEVSQGFVVQLYIVIAITFLLGLTVVIFCVFYLRRLYAKEMRIQHLNSEHKKELLEANIEVQEKERIRIASDLHDEVGAMLSTIKLYVSNYKVEEPMKASHERVGQLIDQTVQKVRDISHSLTPVNLQRFGLVSTLEAMCDQINHAGGLRIRFQYDGEMSFLSEEHNMHVYRIAQELVNNTLKHADAREVKLSLRKLDNKVVFLFEDDGIGFNSEDVENRPIKRSLGLSNIRTRTEIIGGRIDFPYTHKGFKARLVLDV